MFKIENVYTSVWIATALLCYERYFSLLENNKNSVLLNEFYFSQRDIQNKAKSICVNKVQSARISQWCNGSHEKASYNYLVSRKSDSLRRMSVKGEFDFYKEIPVEVYNHLILSVMINNSTKDITYNDLFEWVNTIYYSFPISSDTSEINYSEKENSDINQKMHKTKSNIKKIDNSTDNEKFIINEELTYRDLIFDNIINFLSFVQDDKIEIYNEFSLQHELGVFLRNTLENNLKIQFERNVQYFFQTKEGFTKKEMDITLFSEDFSSRYCIELKFPKNGKYPEEMFSICKDIKFLEELKNKGFSNCYSLTIVEDRNFYSSSKSEDEKIYKYFRNNFELHGEILKPTGSKTESFSIEGNYLLKWKNLNNYKFLLVKI